MEEFERFIKPYKDALDSILVRVNSLNEDFRMKERNYPIHNIQSRIKKEDSIFEKLGRLGLTSTLDNARNRLTDIAGIRIICYFEKDVYQIAENLKKQSDVIIIKEKDYVANPKPNGYRSYHLVLGVPVYFAEGKAYYPVEIQLRTLAMDLWASMEHRIIYKSELADHENSRLQFQEYSKILTMLENNMKSLLKSADSSEN